MAKRIKKTPKTVESWETGAATPTYGQLEILAYKIYKRPLALFFFPKPPSEPDPEKSFRTLPQSEAEELSADTRLKIREAQAFQISLSELTDGVNPSKRKILQRINVSIDQPVELAVVNVRRFFSYFLTEPNNKASNTNEALKNWRAMIEDAGIFVFKDSFKQKSISGFSLYHREFPMIIINNSTAVTRQIFTLFHEFAHLLLHVSGVTKEDDSFISDLEGDEQAIEVFCNRLAGEFLMPKETLNTEIKQLGLSDLSVAKLARKYNVSREVIYRRLLDLGFISQQLYQRVSSQLNEEYEAMKKREGGGNYYLTHASYLSERYAKLAFSKYYSGAITVEQLAYYLNVSTRSVPGLEQIILQKNL